MKEIDDTLEIGAILPNPSDDDIPIAHDLGATAIGVHYTNMSLRRIKQAGDFGMHIRAWNPDDLDDMKAMIGLGVSGVSTNRPDILVEHLRAAALGEEFAEALNARLTSFVQARWPMQRALGSVYSWLAHLQLGTPLVVPPYMVEIR